MAPAGQTPNARRHPPTPEQFRYPAIKPKQDFEKYSHTRWTPHKAIVLGAYMPTVFFVVLVTLFTYAYAFSPIAPWAIAVLSADIAIVRCWPPALGQKGRNRWDWSPMFICIFAVGAGVSLGLVNYSNIEAWIHATYLNEYKEVTASTSPEAVADAGVLKFASGTSVDVASSAGYRAWPYTYCAAPIVGQDSPEDPVGFWAVGVNCCNSRGGFDCDSTPDKEARHGIRLDSHRLDHIYGRNVKENFLRAVDMSAAANGLVAAKSPALVAWHKSAADVASASWWTATFVLMLSAASALACCSFLWRPLMLQVSNMQR